MEREASVVTCRRAADERAVLQRQQAHRSIADGLTVFINDATGERLCVGYGEKKLWIQQTG